MTVRVVEYVKTWLARTENWIYWQLRSFPPDVIADVVCERTRNKGDFPYPRIHSFTSESMFSIMADKAARKAGLRDHLGFLVDKAKALAAGVLHSHFGHVGWANIDGAAAAHVKHVVTFYGTDVGRLPHVHPRWKKRYERLFATVDRVLCEGPFMQGELIRLGCPRSIVQVLAIGVPIDEIQFVPRTWDRHGPLRVLIAASFQEKKGIPDGIRALSLLRPHVPDLSITIIGDSTGEKRSEQEKRRILAAVRESGLERNVNFLGYQSWSTLLSEAYRNHIFLSPSKTASDGDSEGGAPVSIPAMLASGMPVVSTQHCDIPFVVRHGETGLLSKEGDVAALAEHLIALSTSPDSWSTMGTAGRSFVAMEHDVVKQAAKLASIYESVL